MRSQLEPLSPCPALNTAGTTAAACRRVFRRKNALHADALAARDALQRAAAGLTAYRQALANLRRVGDALLPRICGPEGYASANARPFLWDALSAKLYDIERLLFDAHDTATGQASAFVRLARELENAGEVRHA
ncbi:hypothetical protein [uncultured Desulfovibrio sp.]|uniref:hypothetical protein n=1 Tax=uncultured Desulfovibrio sp. TaxID=167968 RepID=UPI00262235C2|nr:hypothetical protein [uncultured Desulfovibrio sp.]